MTGTTKWFDAKKGFGFLTCDDKSDDVFVHHSSIQAKGFKLLSEGDRVQFDIIPGQAGKGPKATNVVIIGHAEPQRREPRFAQRRD